MTKTLIQDITIYVAGIDMSSAFDTIEREQLIDIVKDLSSLTSKFLFVSMVFAFSLSFASIALIL